MSKKAIKNNSKINRICTKCYNPKYIKFNFSFITYDEHINDRYKVDLYNRIIELSSEPYIIIQNKDKKLGFEIEKININKKISGKFEDLSTHRKIQDKYTIFRLYPNDNPIKARIIGYFIKNIFYILFIDIRGELYKH